MDYTIFKYEGARVWNRSYLSYKKNAGSARKFQFTLNGMGDDVCECNSFNRMLCIPQMF